MPRLQGNIRHIHVKNCENIFVPSGTIIDLPDLVMLTFENIGELNLQEFSFNSTRKRNAIQLEIINSSIPRLPPHFLKGNVDEIKIRDSVISKIHAFAFTGFFSEINAIKISSSVIGEIEAQAFRKLTIRNLEILNTTLQTDSASKSFYDCLIRNINIDSSRFATLQPSSFDVAEVQRFLIQNSTFGVIEGEAFVMEVSDRVIFNNNKVTAMSNAAFRGEFRQIYLRPSSSMI